MLDRQHLSVGIFICLLLFGIGLAVIQPRPHTIEDIYGNATVEFTAHDTLVLETECYRVSWNTEQIAGVYLNDNGKIGNDSDTVCPEDDYGTEPRLRIVFQDNTEKTYTIGITVLSPPVVPISIIISVLLLAGIGSLLWQRPMPEDTLGQSLPRLQLIDIGIIILIMILTFIGFLYTWETIATQSIVHSDVQHNIMSPVVSKQYPTIFQNDFLLSSDITSFYQTANNWLFEHIIYPLIQEPLLAISILTIPLIIFHHLGFYWLSLTVTKNRLLIVLFVLLISSYVRIHELRWGIHYDFIPRLAFQTFLPYIFMFALLWRDMPRRWVWLMVGCGLMAYVHSVSTPAIGFAIWLGLWLNHPPEWTIRKRFAVMFGLGMVFLITLVPFGINYWVNASGSRLIFDVDLILQISKIRLEGYYDTIAFTQSVFDAFLNNFRIDFIIIASGIFYIFGQAQQRHIIRHVWVWGLGILFVAVCINWIDHTIADRLGRLPLQIDLVRSIRYLAPIILFVPLIGLNAALLTSRKSIRFALNILILLTIIVFSLPFAIRIPTMISATSIEVDASDNTALFAYIQETVPESSSIGIFFTSKSNTMLGIRHSGLRSIAWIHKDGNFLAYSDTERLIEWFDHWNTIEGITRLSNIEEEERWQRFNQFAQEIDADYIVYPYFLYSTVQEVVDGMGFKNSYETRGNSSVVLLHIDEPVTYERVNLTEFTQQENYSPELEVTCNLDGVLLRDVDTDNELHVPYDTIDTTQATIEGNVDIVIDDFNELRLSALTPSILKAELEGVGYYIFSLYRCRFNPEPDD